MGVVGTALRVRRFGDAELTIQTAIKGLGVTLIWHRLVMNDLKSGRLARVQDCSIPSEFSFQLVMPQNKTMQSKVAAIRSWLFEQVEQQSKEGGPAIGRCQSRK
ncbi:MAG: LysR substrate-binding domain-containing protein [Gallionella sp.]